MRKNREKQFQGLTRNDPLRIEIFGKFHELPDGRLLGPAQPVLHDQGVFSVVDVGGLVEEETAVFHRPVARVRDELRVGVLRLLEVDTVVEPGDVGLGVPIHGEGETPVVLLHGVLQEEDFDRNCGKMLEKLRTLYLLDLHF